MRDIILFSAVSIDGYIARTNGDIDWLSNGEVIDYGYDDFYATIDTTLMGHATYKQVCTFGEFPYPDLSNYVFSRSEVLATDPKVQFVSGDPVPFIRELKQREGKSIWLVGGGQLNAVLLDHKLIDTMWLFVIPVVLGTGIPLFAQVDAETHFHLTDSKVYPDGTIKLVYQLKPHAAANGQT